MAKHLNFRNVSRKTLLRTGCAAACFAAVGVVGVAHSAGTKSNPSETTMGFVVTDWRYAMRETPGGKEECPDGMTPNEKDQWDAMFPARAKEPQLGGNLQVAYTYRGPHGESSCYNPTLVKDPLPMKTVQSKVGFGLHLDGAMDGSATANTCAHQTFTTPDGEAGVENQMYRVLGCIKGWRKTGFVIERYLDELRTDPVNRLLVEVTDVQDPKNDDDVTVTFYKGMDPLVRDASGQLAPWTSQRIENDARYVQKTHGRIKDGVLTTDPMDLRAPTIVMESPGEHLIRGMRLKMKLSDIGAKGLMGGYYDLDHWWSFNIRSYHIVASRAGEFSCPSLYNGLHDLADGYPDPVTKKCTAISTAFDFEMMRAYVIHPETKVSSAQAGEKH